MHVGCAVVLGMADRWAAWGVYLHGLDMLQVLNQALGKLFVVLTVIPVVPG